MNIRIDFNIPINDGTEVVFRSPVDCSQVTGLIVYYPDNGNTISKEFAFADAHGNNVGDIDHLFTEDVVVKVILDVTKSMAFVQNADTNAYLEGRFDEKVGYTEQTFTEKQKEQARKNIGALGHEITKPMHIVSSNSDGRDSVIVTSKITADNDDMLVDVLNLQGNDDGHIDLDTVILRGLHEGIEDTDAVNKKQLDDAIKSVSGGSADGAVLYTEQDLTPEQKAQARENIGAMPEDVFNKTIETTAAETAIDHTFVNGYVNTDGSADSRTAFRRTDYLPIGEFEKVALRFTAIETTRSAVDLYIARYDKDKNYIAGSRGTLPMWSLDENGEPRVDYDYARASIAYINNKTYVKDGEIVYQYGMGIDINPADYADGTEYIIFFNFQPTDVVTWSVTGFAEPQEVVRYTIPEEMLPPCTEAEEAKELAQEAITIAQEAKELAQKPTEEIPLADYVEPLVDKIALAAKAHMKEDSLCFVLFTDTHYRGNDTCFPTLIAKKLAQATNASAILHLGDLAHLYTEDKYVGLEIFQRHSKILQDTKIPYMQVVGNHDDGQMYLHHYTHDYSAENYIKAYEMYHATTKQSRCDIVLGSKNGWYYMDDEDSKTRLIVLNSHEYPWVVNDDGTLAYDSNAVSSINCIYSTEQLEWLANTALNFADKGDVTEQAKWSVLAFAHMGTNNWSAINSLFTAFWAGTKKTSFSSAQTDTHGLYNYSGITITNDFSLVGKRKIAFLMGDIHKDKVSGGNYPLITFLDCQAEAVKLGTPNEAALSVLVATPSEGTITELRFGEGTKTVDGVEVAHDPLTDYDNYRVISY